MLAAFCSEKYGTTANKSKLNMGYNVCTVRCHLDGEDNSEMR